MYYTAEQLVHFAKLAEGFKEIPAGYWLAGIRAIDQKPNQFNCVVNLMEGERLVMETTCTTVPGLPALKGGFRKYNSKGAAVVCSNIWMYNAFKKGKHAGRMWCLRMVKKVWSTRDGNLNDTAEEYGKRTFANVACNFHAADWNKWTKIVRFLIGHWSYGCIVCNNRQEYNKILEIVGDESVSMVILNEPSI